jgi:hypothetical protein
MKTNEIRTRKFFIRLYIDNNLNQQDILNQLKNEKPKIKYYALINHNKENLSHYHIYIEYENPFTISQVKKQFEIYPKDKNNGIQIENVIPGTESRIIQYLIHKNNPEKYQYEKESIITNIRQNTLLTLLEEKTEDKEYFNANKIIEYISQGTNTFIEFYIRFGKQIIHYQTLIKNVLNEYKQYLKEETEKEEEERIKALKELENKELPF